MGYKMKTASKEIQSLESRSARLQKEASRRRGWGKLLYKLKKQEDAKKYLENLLSQGVIDQEEFESSMGSWIKRNNNALYDYFENRSFDLEPKYPDFYRPANHLVGKAIRKAKFISQRFVDTIFESCKFNQCAFIGVHYKNGSFKESTFANCSFKKTTFLYTDFIGVRFINTSFDNCDFSEAQNLQLMKNMTEKQIEKLLEQKLSESDRGFFEELLLQRRDLSEGGKEYYSPQALRELKEKEEKRKREEEKLKREEEKRKRIEESEKHKINLALEKRKKRERKRTLIETKRRIDKAKTDKELEALAVEVGSLQAQPEYLEEYGQQLENLQETIESKYSTMGKGLRFLKRMFSRGKRAAQLRIANQMGEDLHKEIRDLKGRLK